MKTFRIFINGFQCFKAKCFVPSGVLCESFAFHMSGFKGTNKKDKENLKVICPVPLSAI